MDLQKLCQVQIGGGVLIQQAPPERLHQRPHLYQQATMYAKNVHQTKNE